MLRNDAEQTRYYVPSVYNALLQNVQILAN